MLDFGGLLGYGPIMPVNSHDPVSYTHLTCDHTEFLTTPITPQITLTARNKVAARMCSRRVSAHTASPVCSWVRPQAAA